MPEVNRRPTWTVSLPSGWARAGLAGVEAALIGWAVPALLAATSLLVLTGDPWLQEFTLGQASSVGTALWALTLGGQVPLGGVVLTLIPLGWSVAQVLILRGLLLSGRHYAPAAQWFAVPLFLVTTTLILAATGLGGLIPSSFAGAFLIPFTAALWAVVSYTRAWPGWVRRLSAWWAGVGMSFVWLGVANLVALVAVVVATFSARHQIGVASTELGVSGWSSVVLILLQLAYLPVFMAWALAWLSGAGFVLDEGSVHSAFEAGRGTLFELPVLAALPVETVGSLGPWLLVGAGVICGVVAALRWSGLSLGGAIQRGAMSMVVFAAMVALWFSLSAGSLGGDRLAWLGPVPAAWLTVTALVAGPALVTSVILHPKSLDAARSLYRTDAPKKPEEPAETSAGEGEYLYMTGETGMVLSGPDSGTNTAETSANASSAPSVPAAGGTGAGRRP